MAYSGDSHNNGSGLVLRTSKLYNSGTFSDLEFLVRDPAGDQTFKAHKLIFAMASEQLAKFLYKEDTYNTRTHKIVIPDFRPQIFQLTMQYLYTDKLILTNVQEAIEVGRLSLKFGIRELVEKCKNYIGQDKITKDNIFFMYEIALKENIKDLLIRCRDTVCANTKAVFSSKLFLSAPIEVLEDILKQDSLAVENELEVIDAVLLWCKQDCVRKGRPVEAVCIRASMSPFLPYLRFLTLSGEEFCDFVDQNCIFSSPETALLTRKILEPDGDCRVPTGFCTISRPRGTVNKNGLKTDGVKPSPSKLNGNTHVQRSSLAGNGRQQSYDETSRKTRPPHSSTSLPTANDSHYSMQTYSPLQNRAKDENQPVQSKTTMPSVQYNGAMLKSPMIKVGPPTDTNQQKIYDFNLLEMPKAMGSMSKRDLICTAEIKVFSGSMVIYGIDLKILNLPNDPNETITVCRRISGDVPEINRITTERLSNHVIHIQFSDPLKLAPSNSAKIQITIEDLKLHRCFVSKLSTCELNSGLNLNAVINLKSNQTNETEGFFFLISRLFYS